MTDHSAKHLFISVGTRFAMDRLLNSVEEILGDESHLTASAQVGPSEFTSTLIKVTQWADSRRFEQAVSECDIFVSHAGMGNILMAAKLNKHIIIMPRRADLGEHINDHQISTAQAMKDKPFVCVVNNTKELALAIHSLSSSAVKAKHLDNQINHAAKAALISAIKDVIDQ